MRYAINLNLDYASHEHGQVKALFQRLRSDLIEAGFRQDGRLFTIELPEAEACGLARNVIEATSRQQGFGDIYAFVKEFYGFDFETANNLLLPPADNIGVVEMGELPDMECIDLKPPRDS
ncbi:MAG: hypothetical protein M0R77_16510 [Gammaproteobacteria bacterium]|nr:hypothetical protein [Gammaproteobacteria bacterium]